MIPEPKIFVDVEETEIMDGLFVGSWDDAKYFKHNHGGLTLCVLEVITTRDFDPDFTVGIIDQNKMKVDPFKLEICEHIIRECANRNLPLLVHCRQGIERSPLTVAWYLTKCGMSMDQAYCVIKSKRPYVIDRRSWLEKI